MAKLSISKAWEESVAIFLRDGRLFVAVALALSVLPQVIVTVAGYGTQGLDIPTLLAGLVVIIGDLAIVRLAVGPSTSVAESMRHGVRRFPITVAAYVLLFAALLLTAVPVLALLALSGAPLPEPGVAISGTTILLVLVACIPMAFLWVRFVPLLAVASEEQIGPMKVLLRCWQYTRGNYWRLLAYEVLVLILQAVVFLTAWLVGGAARSISGGVEPFTLGMLVSAMVLGVIQAGVTILTSVMVARIYLQLAGPNHASTSVPSSRD